MGSFFGHSPRSVLFPARVVTTITIAAVAKDARRQGLELKLTAGETSSELSVEVQLFNTHSQSLRMTRRLGCVSGIKVLPTYM